MNKSAVKQSLCLNNPIKKSAHLGGATRVSGAGGRGTQQRLLGEAHSSPPSHTHTPRYAHLHICSIYTHPQAWPVSLSKFFFIFLGKQINQSALKGIKKSTFFFQIKHTTGNSIRLSRVTDYKVQSILYRDPSATSPSVWWGLWGDGGLSLSLSPFVCMRVFWGFVWSVKKNPACKFFNQVFCIGQEKFVFNVVCFVLQVYS